MFVHVKVLPPLSVAYCDLLLGPISPETRLPTLPFASHDHGSGQLLNAGVSAPRLSGGGSIATGGTRVNAALDELHIRSL